MGVQGLWDLVSPCGKTVSLESLKGKVLAIDASIFLTQLVRAVGTDTIEAGNNAHLRVMFHRICKLLHYGVKPVFVFDGATPDVKLKTLQRRRQMREDINHKITKLAQRLVQKEVQMVALEDALKDENSRANRQKKKEQKELEELGGFVNPEELEADAEEADMDDYQVKRSRFARAVLDYAAAAGFAAAAIEDDALDVNGLTYDALDQDVLKALKPETRYELLTTLRARERYQNHTDSTLDELATKSMDDFSAYQVSRFLKGSELSKEIDNVRKEMNTAALPDFGKENEVIQGKLSSDASKSYLLIKRKALLDDDFDEEFDDEEDFENAVDSGAKETRVPGDESSVPNRDSLEEAGFLEAGPQMAADANDTWDFRPEQMAKARIELRDEDFLHDDDDDFDEEIVVRRNRPVRQWDTVDVESEGEVEIQIEEGDPDEVFAAWERAQLAAEQQQLSRGQFLKSSEDIKKGPVIDIDEEQLAAVRTRILRVTQKPENEPQLYHDRTTNEAQQSDPSAKSPYHAPADKDIPAESPTEELELDVPVMTVSRTGVRSSAEPSSPTPPNDIGAQRTAHGQREHAAVELTEEFLEEPGSDEQSLPLARFAVAPETMDDLAPGFLVEEEADAEQAFTSPISQERVPPAGPSAVDEESSTTATASMQLTAPVLDDDVQAVLDEDIAHLAEEEAELLNATEEPSILPHDVSAADLPALIHQLRVERQSLRTELESLTKQSSYSAEVFLDCREMLHLFGIPYLISPFESDSQCAFLSQNNLVDGIVSEDSDMFVFGGAAVYRNLLNFASKHVEEYRLDRITHEIGLTPEKMVLVAMLLGSDYTDGIRNVGIVTAMEIVAEFPTLSDLDRFSRWLSDYTYNYFKDDACTPGQRGFFERFANQRRNFETLDPAFPARHVAEAYLRPIVDNSLEPFRWGRPRVEMLVAYGRERFQWDVDMTMRFLQPVLQTFVDRQMRLDAFFSTGIGQTVGKIRSRRLYAAIVKLTDGKTHLRLDKEANEDDPDAADGQDGTATTVARSSQPSAASASSAAKSKQRKVRGDSVLGKKRNAPTPKAKKNNRAASASEEDDASWDEFSQPDKRRRTGGS